MTHFLFSERYPYDPCPSCEGGGCQGQVGGMAPSHRPHMSRAGMCCRATKADAVTLPSGVFRLMNNTPVYVSAVRPQSKHIVVMVDHGASVTETQLQIAKDSALVILNSIDEHDKVSILSVADTVRSCSLDQCYKSLLSPATSETKRKMGTFISNIKASDGFTKHAAGFQKAFQLLRNTTSLTKHPTMFNSVTATDMVIIYLSSGITSRESSEKEKKATLSVVREENRLLNNSVMILTYALMNGFIMTVSRPCYFGNLLLGVVGVDVNLAYILEDVTYYQDSLASYTFLIDNKESPTVMLAAGSFSSPYEHLSQPETKRMVEHYTAYLSDNTRLIANPASRYQHAVANPGLITFTGPYLDVGGAGYVVTISHTIHASSNQMAPGYAVAVMGIDFTLRYFYKVLLDLLPVCNQDRGNKIRCFIMEDRGYLVAHPTLIDPKGHAPAEQQHITHKGDLTNLVHGSHCSKYRLTRIPGTNAFAGIVNETCDSLAFCACSTVDRLCLNCHRMEQNECECPCECPLEVNECTGNLTNAENRNPSCEVLQEPLSLNVIDPSLHDTLPQCINTRCSQRYTSSDCFGVLDCEWCMVDSDGKTHLDKPYCALQKECFGGIVGAKSPYVDNLGLLEEDVASLNMIKSAPVGPVAGGIMGCIMVLVLAVYAYRHQIHRRSHQHMSPLAAQEMSVRMSNLDNERDERDEDSHEDRGIISNTRFIAAVIERHTHTPERRRRYWGRSGTESDHGYSTMSPQEDSENPPGNNDPLSAGVDVGNHDDDLDLDTPPQTAALLSHKFHPYRHSHTHHHPLHTHTHHLQAAVTVHSVDAEC
ncbi:hypothetical protein WMY93_024547 [Mugilogobius chulae]|uniref:VWFA domain-containing protein n=1 Tax=Mugilogobius chulae TaxID=88201 RepID=A0AAW0NAX5_9GOBI